MKHCKYCGKPFETPPYAWNKIYCSNSCLQKSSHPEQEHSEQKAIRNAQIITDREQGLTVDDCSKKYGLSSSTIRNICRKKNISSNISNLWKGNPEIRFCEFCGEAFIVEQNIKKTFCSEECRKKEYHRRFDVNRRIRKRSAVIDCNITLKRVYAANNGICYLCGKVCDWSDYIVINGKKCAKGNYPSVEHIVALANGGEHSWENVKLAHISCNARKGVKAYG